MMSKSIATVITYCTNDYRFISKCIREAKIFSKQVIVSVCDHFFNGEKENRHLLNHTYAANPDCQFIEFAYLPDRLYSKYHFLTPKDRDWAAYWAATSRYVGFQYVEKEIDTVLFLDSDEIADGNRFLKWHRSEKDAMYAAMRLGSYYYALKPTLRAERFVNIPLMVNKEAFSPLTLYNGLERIGAYLVHEGPKKEFVLGEDEEPFFHHYSWVRTKEESLHKGKTWSHHLDQDWPALIEEAFETENLKNLFGTKHTFEKIKEPYFDPFSIEIPDRFIEGPFENVLKINSNDLFRKEILNELL